jgi:uncharacterized protein (DUF1501 family)
MSLTRRSFVRYASLAAAGNAAGLRLFGALNGLAETTPDYKALVCIFLFGGNDSNNMLIPFSTTGYAKYASIRGPLALPQNTLLQLAPSPLYALNPYMPEIQTLYDRGAAAFLVNVGTLVRPLTRPEYLIGSYPEPANLFSHSDQQLEWQNALQSGEAPTGWGGRIADKLTSRYNPNGEIPMVSSVSGNALFCNGASTSPVTVRPGDVSTGSCSEGDACAGRRATEQQIVTFASGFSLVQADNEIITDADKYISTLADDLQSVSPLQTQFPAGNGLALQLRQIAQIIQVRQSLGVSRQIFFASLGGFDTHFDQLAIQDGLLATLSSAMGAFYQATEEMGVADQVTSFTMSDFSRALQPNSRDGSDHGWGGHQIMMGGAVHGGKIYGTFPILALGGPDDSGINGRWIPTTSVTQYAATLARWFGVSAAELSTVLPLIGNFSRQSLGFMA